MNSTLFRQPSNGTLIWWGLMVLLAVLAGCDKPSTTQKSANQTAASAGEGAPEVVVTDELPGRPERIVSLAPNVTEILFALDAGDRLVGVTRFCDYPAQAAEIPKVGGIVDVDLEAILAKEPDLVVGTSSGADPKIAKKLDDAGIPYGFVRMDNLAQTYRGIAKIGELVGAADKAEALAADMEAKMDRVADSARDGEHPRVLMIFGRNPLIAAGPGTFGHELVELAGGKNVLADAKAPYPKLDIEKVISLDPERIIDATMAGEGLDTEFWNQYPSIDAVERGHVYLIDDPVVLRPAPRLVDGLRTIREAIVGSASARK
ncbi:hypothetical protein FIV42_11055 [Persicimonas caeni]|uniref:Fe/B12 periplasmic-binding domain-containing protein n=2 Tax=Persicimonas caeni TaxID=2292766 RepID=A0A4Y6PSI3_PERCE|nr:hypothetical protein FIV42_11055 [Persicimonas caeni]QED32479.1 ABC transporter substrate-binding protein [Persicimonas caeni]